MSKNTHNKKCQIHVEFGFYECINSGWKDKAMEAKQKKIDESDSSENESGVKTEEKTLILLKSKAKKNIDETISAPDKYVSRYHYTSQNMDRCLEFCPHCKKPTLSAFRVAVINSAVEYLEGKRVLIDHSRKQRGILTYITCLLAIVTGMYFLLHILSVGRV